MPLISRDAVHTTVGTVNSNPCPGIERVLRLIYMQLQAAARVVLKLGAETWL